MKLRKTKKAYKLGRSDYNANRYVRYLLKLKQRRIAAMKAIQSAMVIMMGRHRIATIQATRALDKFDKAMAIASEVVDTGRAVANVWNS